MIAQDFCQTTENRSVGGSIPPLGTKDFKTSQVVNGKQAVSKPGRTVTGGILGAQSVKRCLALPAMYCAAL
jgi:hypothetical protein